MSWLREWAMKAMEVVRHLRPQENLFLKIGSLVAALLIWVTVASQEPVPFELTVPLVVQSLPPEIAPPKDAPAEVRVKLRGRPSAVDQVQLHEVGPVPLDLSRARPGPQMLTLDPESIRVPFGITIESLEPAVVELTLERLLRRKIPIVPNLTGEPAPDYEIVGTALTPPTALVSGAEGHLDRIESLTTAPVPLEGKKAPFAVEVPLFAAATGVTIVQPEKVEVRLEIAERMESRTLQVPVETVGWVPGRVTWEPRVLPLTVRGPVSQMRELDETAYSATVRVDGLTPKREGYRVEPEIVLLAPDRFPSIEIVEPEQPIVRVQVYPGEGS